MTKEEQVKRYLDEFYGTRKIYHFYVDTSRKNKKICLPDDLNFVELTSEENLEKDISKAIDAGEGVISLEYVCLIAREFTMECYGLAENQDEAKMFASCALVAMQKAIADEAGSIDKSFKNIAIA